MQRCVPRSPFATCGILVLVGLGALQAPVFAHGGTYRGPGDTVPPAGGGTSKAPGGTARKLPASRPGPTFAGSTPGPKQPGAITQAGIDLGADLSAWSFWWEFNKEPFLNLKSTIQTGGKTGSDTFFLGRGEQDETDRSQAPSEQEVRQLIVPALLRALEAETNNDIVTGALIALAKIGDPRGGSTGRTLLGKSPFEKVIARFLSDGNQEISETAAIALGILANPHSIPVLAALLNDVPHARKELVKAGEVPYRTRAFAAFGLGLIGASPDSPAIDKQRIVDILVQAIEDDDTASRDLQVACIIALGLCPVEEMTAQSQRGERLVPSSCRVEQLRFLLNFLDDEKRHHLVRAHCPAALARLLEGMPLELHAEWRTRLATDFMARAGKGSRERNEIVQSAILALGQVGDNGNSRVARNIRSLLAGVPKSIKNIQARNFSMIATGQAGGTMGPMDIGAQGDAQTGISEAARFLTEELTRGKSTIRPWAGLAVGILSDRVQQADVSNATLNSAGRALRHQLGTESNASRLGAYAIASGIMRDPESEALLLEHLDKLSQTEARGYVAIALGLLGSQSAKDPLLEIMQASRYRPELLKQVAIALGLLRDRRLVGHLIEMLRDAKGLATQASISSALGFIGDRSTVQPLLDMLENKQLTSGARAFAAVALGIVADKELLPWNSKIAEDLNYRASTQTLVDAQSGTGILDIL